MKNVKYYQLLVILGMSFSGVSFAQSSFQTDDHLKANEALFASIQQVEEKTQFYASDFGAVAIVPVVEADGNIKVVDIASIVQENGHFGLFDLSHSTAYSRFRAQLRSPLSAISYLAKFLEIGSVLNALVSFYGPSISWNRLLTDLFRRTVLNGNIASVAAGYYLFDKEGARSLEVEQALNKVDRKLVGEIQGAVIAIPAQEMNSLKVQLRKMGYRQFSPQS
jgi:hypothetical protein